jgi:hypothetical protein
MSMVKKKMQYSKKFPPKAIRLWLLYNTEET